MTPATLQALMSGDFENAIAAATPGGIERQEALAQTNATRKPDRFPRFTSAYRRDAEHEAEVRAQAEIFGFSFSGDIIDSEFQKATFPPGWRFKPTDHSMWSDLLDDQGRKRASMFFKGAFYDYEAFISWLPRYAVEEVRPDNWYKLISPDQPEVLYKTEETWVALSAKEIEAGIANPSKFHDDYGRFDHKNFRGRGAILRNGKAYRVLTNDGWGGYNYGGYGGNEVPTEKRVVRQWRLPDKDQPKKVRSRGYNACYVLLDRATGKVLYKGKDFHVPSHDREGHYALEEARKEKHKRGLLNWMARNIPDERDLKHWLKD